MFDRHFNPDLPSRQIFICKIKGDPFISRTEQGLTVCSLPVEISGEGGGRSRLIVRGEAADRCLSSFRIGRLLKVTGIKKTRPLQKEAGASLVEIVAWTLEIRPEDKNHE